MNKFGKRTVGGLVALAMAAGVGVAIGATSKGAAALEASAPNDSGISPSAGVFVIDFYDSEKLSSTSGTGLSAQNYSNFVKVDAGLTKTNVVTGVSVTGTVQYGKNGGLTAGTGTASESDSHYVTFSIGSDYAVNKCSVYATAYETGRWKLNDTVADSGSLGTKGATIANVTNPFIWDNLGGVTSLTFKKDNGSNGSQKRLTIYTIVCEYSTGGSSGTTTNITRAIHGPENMNKYIDDPAFDIAGSITIDDEASATGYSVSSSNTNAVTVAGTTLTPVGVGNSTITISKPTNTVIDGDDTTNYIYTPHTFTVKVANPPIVLPDMPDGDYQKISTTSDLVNGYYLLVDEDINKVFDGSLDSLDSQAGAAVTISDHSIETTSTIDQKALYISALEGTNKYSIVANVKEASPVYIGRDGTSNGLETSTEVLENTITISDGLAEILGAGGRKLNYLPSNSNFRYYASSNATKVSLYKKVSTAPVVDVYSENINVSKGSTTIPLGDSETITATIDQAATVRTITWESNNAKVHVTDGAISVDSDATVNSTATITAKVPASAAEGDFLTATCTVTVGPAKLTGLHRNGYNAFYVGQKISDFEGGSITASWTAGDDTAISLDDAHLSITLGGNAVTKDTVLAANDNGKQIQFTYTDPNYDGVSKYTSNHAISVGEFFAIDDMVAHFDDDNAYILSTSDSGNNYLSFSYTSWGGKATIDSVTSSKEDLVVASLTDHTFSSRSGTGTIGLLTDGESKGQAIITLTATVESTTIQKSYVVTVRNTAPSVTPGDTSYELVNSLTDVTTGNYVIAANVDGTYYAMSNSFASKIDGSIVSVSNGKISADMSDYVVTLTRSGSNLSIFNGDLYLKLLTSGTDFGTQTDVFNNTIEDGNVANRGSFKISNTRALAFRAGSTNKFGNYATNNITASGEYYYVELFKEVSEGGTADDTTVVQNFVTAYMQPSIDPSQTSDTGACRGENGYYNVAKTHLSTDLNGAQRLIFRDDFDAYYQRMVKWGIACTENFSIDNDGNIVTSPRNAGALSSFSNNVGSVTSAFVAVSVVGLAAVGGMVFLRKRRAI